MSLETPDWECVVDTRAGVSEVPIWSSTDQALYWIDIFRPSLGRSRFGAAAGLESWPLPEIGGSYALCADGQHVLVASGAGIHVLELATGSLETLHHAPYDRNHYRFNDGRCDPRGRFWVGTLRVRGSQAPDGSGAFWRLDGRGLSRELEGITVANGLAFSPACDTMYVADSVSSEVWAFDYDLDAGVASNRRCFARLPEGWVPDGAAVDSEGRYWIAIFGAGRLLRYATDGHLDCELRTPVSYPTMAAFGGDALDNLYITSARRPLDADGLRAEPLAGGIFRCKVKTCGLPEPVFAFL